MTGVRLLLGKDLRVLRRSPALLAALVLYPLLFAALVGLVVRFASDRPTVAFVDLDGLPEELTLAGESFDVQSVIEQVNDKAELMPMSEEEAERQLETGEVVAAIVVPRGFASRLRGMVESPELVLRTGRGGLAGRFELQTEALVYRLNRLLQEAYIAANLEYVQLLVEGGEASFLGEEFDVVGLDDADELLDSLRTRTSDPDAIAEIDELANFVDEAKLALEQTDETLSATANPIELAIDREAGRTWLLGAQLQAYALALTLAFVCVLLAAGAVAAERDENVVGRLVRGLVRLWELVTVKVLLGAVVAVAIGLALALVFGVAAEIADVEGGGPWSRLPLLAVGLALAGSAFAAFGVLLGVLARESRTAVLVAFLVTLPLVLVGAGFGVADRGLGEELERDVVQHLVALDEPAVAVRRVLAQADVREQEKPGHVLAQRAQRLLDDPVVLVGARAGLVLLLGDPEEDHGGDPRAVCRVGLLGETIDGALHDPGQAFERPLDTLAGNDEEGLHEVVEREPRLADERAKRRRAAEAP